MESHHPHPPYDNVLICCTVTMAAAAVTSSMAAGITCRTARSAAAAAAVELDRVSWCGRAVANNEDLREMYEIDEISSKHRHRYKKS